MAINPIINPLSATTKESFQEFQNLKTDKKIVTIALSILVGLLTLPVCMIGGFAIFNRLVQHFKSNNLLIESHSTKVESVRNSVFETEEDADTFILNCSNENLILTLEDKELLFKNSPFLQSYFSDVWIKKDQKLLDITSDQVLEIIHLLKDPESISLKQAKKQIFIVDYLNIDELKIKMAPLLEDYLLNFWYSSDFTTEGRKEKLEEVLAILELNLLSTPIKNKVFAKLIRDYNIDNNFTLFLNLIHAINPTEVYLQDKRYTTRQVTSIVKNCSQIHALNVPDNIKNLNFLQFCPSLTWLNLSYCSHIFKKSSDVDHLNRLNLEEIHLVNTKIKDNDLMRWNAAGLKVLNLANCRMLSEAGLNIFLEKIKDSLINLRLDHNTWITHPKFISNLTHLQILKLRGCSQIETLIGIKLPASLNTLDLVNCNFERGELWISEWKKLKYLDLSYNPITGLDFISQLTSL